MFHDSFRRQTLITRENKISYLEWQVPNAASTINQNVSHQNVSQNVLLLHGLADCAVAWSSLGSYLTQQYHVVAPDLRGHGESSKPEQGYSSQEIIADLEQLMKHLGWTSAHILGHSWGGKLATIWGTQNPERFASLILVDPFYVDRFPNWIKFSFPLLYRVLPFLQGMGPFPSQEAAIKLAKNLKQYRQWSKLQQAVFEASIEPKGDGTWGSKFTVAARNQIFEDVMLQSGLTQTLDIPSLFIQPEAGLNRTSWQLRPYVRYLSNLEIKKVVGNHWAFLVAPEEFNQTVGSYLRGLTA